MVVHLGVRRASVLQLASNDSKNTSCGGVPSFPLSGVVRPVTHPQSKGQSAASLPAVFTSVESLSRDGESVHRLQHDKSFVISPPVDESINAACVTSEITQMNSEEL